MGRPFLFLAVFAFAISGAARAEGRDNGAGAPGPRPASAAQTDIFVELVAADFFESNLRLAQSRQIEAATAKRYLSLSEGERAQFREERKRLWRRMSEEEKASLRGAKRPRFANLDETQKQTFRRIASEELGAGPASGVHPGDI